MKIVISKTEIEGKKLIEMFVDGLPFREAIKSKDVHGHEILGLIEMMKFDLLTSMKGDNS